MKKFHVLAVLSLLSAMVGVGSLETGASCRTFAVLIFLSATLALSAAVLQQEDEDDTSGLV